MPANLLSGEHQKKCIEGSKFLSALNQDWNLLVSSVGPCEFSLNLELEPYQALIKSVIFQQLRPTSATAIFKRFKQNFNGYFPTAEQILISTEEELKACGLSSNKLKTIIEISSQFEKAEFDNREGFHVMSDNQIIEKLTKIKGIGEWTAQMLMIFNLGRPDVFPVGDFALRKNYALFKKMSLPISVTELTKISSNWQPYRSIAAWYLWQYKILK
ncbi:MAG: DNA-3-methyladenine glycosylase 2 family protein [Nitrosomonadales bacterium]|jgi:DNA-3-methyladenine glycosylase II|nr:DNA-3-methyladenine glycosylase 2 family protein [Nitrosomonadales bacterium]MBT3918362.1 DNA-3-methyladenine glycosylase 2 family protein [Nitrosomonadales bacterium]MBT4182920.1 DNA-3-methyladenine glycosylase 2 family protein [Nitrosomonadales bacterium]MBT4571620.1 DNA-3-methyladenine glycosylase 2 family protein [Nitrosomonadales bacterium]MBT4759248.1 DNA-3-methyladenine glycosylase 2 family protein [Nitrosomonadales bacterium]